MYHHRRTIRLKTYDYSQAGYYYVTIGSFKHACFWGEIMNQKFVSNEIGKIIEKWFCVLPQRFTNVNLDLIQLMPNHLHCILAINNLGCGIDDSGRGNRAPTATTLGKIIAYWKYNATKEINCRGGVTPPLFKENWNYLLMGKVFQRNYFERIIRNEREYLNIKEYIKSNPKNLERDNRLI